jgi:glycosyltransferase involved in cell wall biosynthesis
VKSIAMIKKICGITTKFVTLKAFMFGNLSYCAKNGYKSYAISSLDESIADIPDNVTYIPVAMGWGNVSPLQLCKYVYRLWKVMRKEHFDIVQYATSNAGLYACIASWLARVPVRIYCQWGISYTDYSGIRLLFYKTMEKFTCMLSTHVQPDSFANLRFAQSEGLYKQHKGSVIYNGSACGVDLVKYDFSHKTEWAKEIKDQYNLNSYKKIFGFVGRVVPEKGIDELLEAFMRINDPNSCLMIVGPLDCVDRLNAKIYTKAKQSKNILFVGRKPNAAKFFAAFDFMMLPSYREGFGMTVLEAAGLATPSICSNINGPTDLIKHGYNGLVCEVKSVESLQKTMEYAINMSVDEYNTMSVNSYKKAKEEFDSEIFKKKFLESRNAMLNRN